MEAEPEQADVHTTLEYRLDAEFADWLPIGVLTIFCGLFLFAIVASRFPAARGGLRRLRSHRRGHWHHRAGAAAAVSSRQSALCAVAGRHPHPLADTRRDPGPVARDQGHRHHRHPAAALADAIRARHGVGRRHRVRGLQGILRLAHLHQLVLHARARLAQQLRRARRSGAVRPARGAGVGRSAVAAQGRRGALARVPRSAGRAGSSREPPAFRR